MRKSGDADFWVISFTEVTQFPGITVPDQVEMTALKKESMDTPPPNMKRKLTEDCSSSFREDVYKYFKFNLNSRNWIRII